MALGLGRVRRLPAAYVLLAANLVPLVGVAFLGWRLGEILLLFWAESAIVGFFGILRMAIAARWLALLLVPFFCVHFGVFMAVHLAALFLLLFSGIQPPGGSDVPINPEVLVPAFAALVLSHLAAFVFQFILRGEWREQGPVAAERQMLYPYQRIIVMHVTILVGAIPTMLLGQPVIALVVLIVMKIVVDLASYAWLERLTVIGPAPTTA